MSPSAVPSARSTGTWPCRLMPSRPPLSATLRHPQRPADRGGRAGTAPAGSWQVSAITTRVLLSDVDEDE